MVIIIIIYLFSLLKIFIYLFIYFQRGAREGEREGEKYRHERETDWLPLARGNAQPTEPHRSGLMIIIFKDQKIKSILL